MIATLFEAYMDRNGDTNKAQDVWIRILLFVLEGALIKLAFGGNVFLAINLSAAFFFLTFDYLIHIILYRNGVIVSPEWFKYTGKSSKVDNLPIWKSIGPYGRLFVKLFYFLLAVWLYFKF